jgi:hypothetical protein
VHGDRPALDWFKQELAVRAPEMQVIIPAAGEAMEL